MPDNNQKYAIDGFATFGGYAELEKDQIEVLAKGEKVKVIGFDPKEDSYVVQSETTGKSDTVFSEELTDFVEEKATVRRRGKAADSVPAAAADASTPATEEAKPAGKKAGRGKATAPAAEGKAVEPEKPATKAPARAPAKAATPAVAAPVVIIESLKDSLGTKQMALDTAARLSGQLSELREQEEQTVFSLGGTLAYVRETEAYKDAGYADMASYVEGALKLRERSAQYYIKVYTDFTTAGVTEKEIEGIGWTKLRTLTGVIEKSNKKNLLSMAKKMSRDDLESHVKELKAKGKTSADETGAPKNLMKFPAFKLFEDQGKALEVAVKRAQTVYEVDNVAEAFYLMAQEWMQGQNVEIPLEDAVAALNARYNTDFKVGEDLAPEQQVAEPAKARGKRATARA